MYYKVNYNTIILHISKNLNYGPKTKEEDNIKDDEDFLEADRNLIGGSLHARVANMARDAHHLTQTVAKAVLG